MIVEQPLALLEAGLDAIEVGRLSPVSRSIRSTPSRSASHPISSSEGTISPRSIWLTYCFVNRPAARSTCVIPAARRRSRTRPPIPAARPSTLLCDSPRSHRPLPFPSHQTSRRRMAAGVGFEPTDELPRQQFSRLPDSTALAPRRAVSVRGSAARSAGCAGCSSARGPRSLGSGRDDLDERSTFPRRAGGVAVPFSRCDRPGADRGPHGPRGGSRGAPHRSGR